jgi:hypothetical protein
VAVGVEEGIGVGVGVVSITSSGLGVGRSAVSVCSLGEAMTVRAPATRTTTVITKRTVVRILGFSLGILAHDPFKTTIGRE